MEAALGFHHCTNMGAEFEFQPKGLIGGGMFRGMSFYRFCECECVCVFSNLHFFCYWLWIQVYTFYFMLCHMCVMYYILQNQKVCVQEKMNLR